jgi:uncharacterized protein YbjT (DUF2867 family)
LKKLILVTGANGYIASRLIPRLLEKGHHVRALVRRPERLAGRKWLPGVEVTQGDVSPPERLAMALQGVHTAYYLVHSMASGRGYTRVENGASHNFASMAGRAGVEHIVYLGGLADPHAKNLAPHMRSRMETGEILRRGKVPVTEFRAGVIVGPGSISFEMIRFLTECFPILPGPTWLHNRVQPIAARNVMDYLMAALDQPQARGGIFEIGGPEIMLYSDTMLRYAKVRGLRRRLFTLPGIPIWFMARLVEWLTPVPAPIASPLIGGLQSDSIVQDDSARRLFPGVALIPYDRAVVESLADLVPPRVERVWEGFGRDSVGVRHEGFFVNYRRMQVNASAGIVYRTFTSMGGHHGWPFANWLWQLRGQLDQLLGGRSPLPARHSQTESGNGPGAREGDHIDYYRIESLEPDHLMRLHAELRAPGEGWMEWRVSRIAGQAGGSELTQTAFFAPRGLGGFLYWFLLYPIHSFVFHGLIRAIARRSESK